MAKNIIEEIMSPVHHVNSDVSLDEGIAYMLSKDTGAILIKNEQGELCRDIYQNGLDQTIRKRFQLYLHSNFLCNVQSHPMHGSNRIARWGQKKMLDNNIRHYVVTDGKNIIGMISNNDLNI